LYELLPLKDLIPPSYLDELSLLQDRISPFSTEVAFNTIEQELGLPIDELFSEISPEPIAAASLGQVYQARLCRTGEVVAVKVQRPGVQAAIALDILILRFLAGLLRRAGKLNTDLQAVVDEWASSLFRVNHIECRRWIT
jgi:aarF domain-containing kinase